MGVDVPGARHADAGQAFGEIICDEQPHPAAKVSAASHFGVALIVAACIA